MNSISLADALGFAGAAIILAAFARSTWAATAPDRLHHGLNFTGAALLAVSLTINVNLPALLLEVAWAAIALFGLVRLMAARR